eukprot:TRINITY_DN10351_c0_g1_i1.p1 TRINITY_DN10351_c0_g1~~TRINITY_DN10351_c0_g1_i1.p1  ORF type:complete len:646 (+),score=168.13 TRINITY_DN10351_c0_g1_i1:43-1938(+)
MAAVPSSAAVAAVSAPSLARAASAAAAASTQMAVGIDLGTKNSVVGVMNDKGTVDIIPCDGQRTTPSVVAFKDDGTRLVGKSAVAQQISNPTNTFYDVKRLIGQQFDSPAVQSQMKTVPYKIGKAADGSAVAVLKNGTQLRPEEVSAAILSKLRHAAESHLNRTVKQAVITVPAYFNDAQRAATKVAGEVAGLDVLRVINEPTAAAVAHGIGEIDNKNDKKFDPKKILIFDLGGGTFDVSALSMNDGLLEVVATAGDTRLGGQDVDMSLMQHVISKFSKQHKIDITQNKSSMEQLRKACIASKHELSTQLTSNVNGVPVTRKELEKVSKPILSKCIAPLNTVMKDSNIRAKDIDKVLLVGGATRMPAVRQLVEKYFGSSKVSSTAVDADEAVATGAAIQAAKLSGGKGREALKKLLLLDVTPLTTGIETQGGYITPIIERNTPIPARQSKQFTTTEQSQQAVDIRVHQGERPRAKDNYLLGEFSLRGIPPAAKGVPKIDVTFNVDANGILKVTAEDVGTKKKSDITIHSNKGLTENDVRRMIADSVAHAKQDAEVKKFHEATLPLRSLIDRAQSSIRILDDADSKSVTDAIADLNKWLSTSTPSSASISEVTTRQKKLQDMLTVGLKKVYK